MPHDRADTARPRGCRIGPPLRTTYDVATTSVDRSAAIQQHRRERSAPTLGDHVQRTLARGGEHRIRIGTVREQPLDAVGATCPLQHGEQRCAAVGGPRAIDVHSVGVQKLEHRQVATADGERQRDAVAGIRTSVEQRGREQQRTRLTHRTPEHRAEHVVVTPIEAQVRIGTERDQPPCDRGGTRLACCVAGQQCRVTHVVQRLPVTRTTTLCGEPGCRVEMCVDLGRVAQHERREQARVCDVGVRREQAPCTIRSFAGGGLDERREHGLACDAHLFDTIAQLVPRGRPMLARDDRLRVVQRKSTRGELLRAHALERGQQVEAGQRRGLEAACRLQ